MQLIALTSFAIALSPVLAQSSDTSNGSTAPCTKTIYHNPPTQTDCTFYSDTTTATQSIDCEGCSITTVRLGVGLACRAETTIPGTSTVNVTSCICSDSVYGNNSDCNSPSSSAAAPLQRNADVTPISSATNSDTSDASSTSSSTAPLLKTACPCTTPPPNATCTKSVLGHFQPLSQATCTIYGNTSTTTECADCGGGFEGCVVKTYYGGPGPAVQCGMQTRVPVSTSTLTYCTS